MNTGGASSGTRPRGCSLLPGVGQLSPRRLHSPEMRGSGFYSPRICTMVRFPREETEGNETRRRSLGYTLGVRTIGLD